MKSNKVNHSLDNLAKSVDANNGRRSFLKRATAATLSFTGASLFSVVDAVPTAKVENKSMDNNETPWFRKVTLRRKILSFMILIGGVINGKKRKYKVLS